MARALDKLGRDVKLKVRSNFGSRAIACSNVRGVFPVHELFWFCLVQVSTIQFCSFSPVLMASVDDGSDVPISPMLGTSSNMVLLMVLGLISIFHVCFAVLEEKCLQHL